MTPPDLATARKAEEASPRHVLVIAYKFPDVILPGGSTRAEKLIKYLPAPWLPVVLSVQVPEEALVEAVHRGPRVHRTRSHYGAFADAYRTVHLRKGSAFRRWSIDALRRLKNLALVPDDVLLWWPTAFPKALRLVHHYRVDAIFASGPPYSGLMLGALVGRAMRVPFVADLRDDWAGNPLAGRRNLTQALAEFPLERWTLGHAARVVHVTEASLELYRSRYPHLAERMELVQNGYDDEDFLDVPVAAKDRGRLRLVHTGSLKDGRDPWPVLDAIERLVQRDQKYRDIRFTQVGTTHRDIAERVSRMGLFSQTEWIDRLPRAETVRLMREADALLLLPTPAAPTAVPGKAYEYLRSGRPVLVVSGENETTRFLDGRQGVVIRRPDDGVGIAEVLDAWFEQAEIPAPDPLDATPYSRRAQAAELATLLEQVRTEAAARKLR